MYGRAVSIYSSDCIISDFAIAVVLLSYPSWWHIAKSMPNNKAAGFIEWFTNGENTVDGKSKEKAYLLFESSLLDSLEVGTVKGLQQIHAYLFGNGA